jgi:hypothetical protein
VPNILSRETLQRSQTSHLSISPKKNRGNMNRIVSLRHLRLLQTANKTPLINNTSRIVARTSMVRMPVRFGSTGHGGGSLFGVPTPESKSKRNTFLEEREDELYPYDEKYDADLVEFDRSKSSVSLSLIKDVHSSHFFSGRVLCRFRS